MDSAQQENSPSVMQFSPWTLNHTQLLLDWANDPLTRKMSFSAERISEASHGVWLAQKIADPHTFAYLAYEDRQPVGQIRFDMQPDQAALISYGLAPEKRGKGRGGVLLEQGIRFFLEQASPVSLRAYVKPDNYPSIKYFERLQFRRSDVDLSDRLLFQRSL